MGEDVNQLYSIRNLGDLIMKKNYLLFLLVIFSFVLSGSAFAVSIPVPSGPISFHWTNWENRVTQTGDPLGGIFRLDQITDPTTSTTVWSNGDLGVELTGVFSGLTTATFGGETVGSTDTFTGGHLDVYIDTNQDFDPTNPGSGVTNGTLWLSADFVTGADILNPAATLVASVTSVGSDGLGRPSINATGTALLSVTGGSAANLFDSNTVPRFDGVGNIIGYADFSVVNTLHITNTGNAPFTTQRDGWDVWSSDPINGFATPEPSTILLFGLGLFGLAGIGRKKFISKN